MLPCCESGSSGSTPAVGPAEGPDARRPAASPVGDGELHLATPPGTERYSTGMPGFRSILCAVDFSPVSRRALEEASDLARRTGTSLAVIHVEAGPPVRREALFAPPPRSVKHEPGAHEALDAWVRDAETIAGRPVGKLMHVGKPAEEILRAAEIGVHDLVVLGTHGRTGVAHAVMGSIAEHVVRHARVPVLVVPAK